MAKTPTEHIRDLTVEVRALKERDATRERDLGHLRDQLAEERNARQRLEVEVSALKQQLQDHVRHTELSDGRRWTLILALLGAALSLAGGLIVALARK
jgi:predicted  nucleic acid-binding Zn-ribbon protein